VLPVGMTPPLVKLHQLPLADLLASNLSCPERSIKGLGMFRACPMYFCSIPNFLCPNVHSSPSHGDIPV
jgi:hypothetical protein